MALLGIYVGVIPIALGMLWLPWMRRIPPAGVRAVMAVSVGLLAFLAVDATLEGLELAAEGSQAFGGALLVVAGAAVAYLGLEAATAWLARRRRACRVRLDARAPDRRRHRAAQPRGGRGDRRRLRRRRARAGRVPRDRLRAPQHHRGAGDRGADRRRAPERGAARGARRARGSARRARAPGSARPRSTPAWPRSCSASARARSSR